MVDSNIPHEIEDRFRNIESHLGIGKTDEETGEYSVQQHETPPAGSETNVETSAETEPEHTETEV